MSERPLVAVVDDSESVRESLPDLLWLEPVEYGPVGWRSSPWQITWASCSRRTIRGGNRASDVIARLRALFGNRESTVESLDVNVGVREVLALSSNDLQRHRIVLRAELADNLPQLTGDRIQLQQVVLNLLRNASDAIVAVGQRQRHPPITTDRENDGRVRVSVRDAGVGLSAQSLDSIFAPFYTTKAGGTGIGFFVSRSIVERRQGRLWAEPNQSSPGATFAFSISYGAETLVAAADGSRAS
jgi:C4-dicarboxylate-specific signal transduction histidine kinase